VTDDRVDVQITGGEDDVLELEETLGEDTIYRLAQAARLNDVMITLTVAPYDDISEVDRGPDDR
jgi:hypothetical protein